MKEFLRQIAQIFYSEYGKDNCLSEFLFVFPNRRPGLFFKKYLSELTQKPIFSPQILTINELFQQLSSLKQEDNIALLFRLFETFRAVVNKEEKFDQFVSWGQMLLNDFNDIDNYCVDAKMLFQNIVEEKELALKFDHLEEHSEEFEIIKQFWKNIPSENERKQYTQNFIDIWKKLPEVYESFKQSLLQDGIAYSGMLCRDAIKNLESAEIPYRNVVFVGFNALNGTEKALFRIFKDKGIADFYWDNCSETFLKTTDANNALRFLQENIRDFPSRFSLENKDQSDKKIEVIALASSIAQTKQVYRIIKELYQNETDKKNLIKTAIVLPDEKLLLPQLYSLPKEILKKEDNVSDEVWVNVTMGYPLDVAPINSLMEHLFDLHKNAHQRDNSLQFYFENVLKILNHPYVYSEEVQNLIDTIVAEKQFWVEESFFQQKELLQKIFCKVDDFKFVDYLSDVIHSLQSVWVDGENELEKAFAFCYLTVLNRIVEQTKKNNLSFSLTTLYLILRQLVKNVKLPFEGEPLSGLQIMGVLETRSLDFENLIITSLNEDIFPKKQSSDSSIPYALRRAFGLPTYEHQDALQAYYFYRLIASAKRVFLLYDSRSDKMGDYGEMSRFIYQLCYRYGLIKLGDEKKISYSISMKPDRQIEVKKTTQILDVLKKRRFSASALNDYFSCPLKFFFSRVAKIEEKEELTERIENNVFGSIVHYTLELLYSDYERKELSKENIKSILENKERFDTCLKKAFSKEYLNKKNGEIVEPKGRAKLVLEIIKTYVKRVLEFDEKNTPFWYIESEKAVDVKFNTGKREVNFYGKIDRLHQKDGKIHVIDYKTGSSKNTNFDNVNSLFDREYRSKNDLGYVFQTIFYSLLLRLDGEKGELLPDIYYIRSLSDEKSLLNCDFSKIEKEFGDKLKELIEEIFDDKVPFIQAEKKSKACEYCSYKLICGREEVKKNDF